MKRFSLKALMRSAIAAVVAMLILAGAGLSITASYAEAANEKESPMLAEQVNSGALPAVKDRLPENPKVLNELKEEHMTLQAGKYGGTLRSVTTATSDVGMFLVSMMEPLVNSPSFTGEEFVGNVVESFSTNDDSSVYTFTLRKGMKWSDGEPVTTEDIGFAVNDVMTNENITSAVPNMYRTGGSAQGNPMTLEIVDDYTFQFIFDGSYPGFLLRLSVQSWPSYHDVLKPKHYLTKYHKDYADAAGFENLLKETGYTAESWGQMFNEYDITNWEMGNPRAIGFPSLTPWVTASVESSKITLNRNPYYFKVDQQERQMPYIDRGEVYYVSDAESAANMVISGQVDYTNGDMMKIQLYKANEEAGNYVTRIANYHGRLGNIYLNFNYEDEDWQRVIQDVRFRKAISLAVNREDILDTVFFGLGILADKIGYGEYDIAQASRLLDELGLDQRNADGLRLYPGGKTVDILFEASNRVPENLPITEMLVMQLKEVGINASSKTIDSALWSNRLPANQIQAFVERMETYWWMADAKFHYWAPLFSAWYNTAGESGTEPPKDILTLMDYARSTTANDLSEGPATYQKLVDGVKESYLYLPVMDDSQLPIITNKNLKNVEFEGDLTSIILNFSMEEMFFEN